MRLLERVPPPPPIIGGQGSAYQWDSASKTGQRRAEVGGGEEKEKGAGAPRKGEGQRPGSWGGAAHLPKDGCTLET